jgi:hypothetical protein
MSIAIRRIKKEYLSLKSAPLSEGIVARPLETNLLHCHFLLFGELFHGTDYEGGVYHGVLQVSSSASLPPRGQRFARRVSLLLPVRLLPPLTPSPLASSRSSPRSTP